MNDKNEHLGSFSFKDIIVIDIVSIASVSGTKGLRKENANWRINIRYLRPVLFPFRVLILICADLMFSGAHAFLFCSRAMGFTSVFTSDLESGEKKREAVYLVLKKKKKRYMNTKHKSCSFLVFKYSAEIYSLTQFEKQTGRLEGKRCDDLQHYDTEQRMA